MAHLSIVSGRIETDAENNHQSKIIRVAFRLTIAQVEKMRTQKVMFSEMD